MNLNWELWFYGLLNAVIGGTATSAAAWLGMAGAKTAGLDVPSLNWKALGVILISGSLTNLFYYLKASPLPSIETKVVTEVKTTETTTTTPAIDATVNKP